MTASPNQPSLFDAPSAESMAAPSSGASVASVAPIERAVPTNTPTTAPVNAAISVGELVARARRAVEGALPLLWVSGEISGLRRAPSGHSYFQLKDREAQVSCVLYRQKMVRVPVQLREGMQVDLRVLATFYAPRGEFQLQVEEVRVAGIGALYEAFAQLKVKLQAEGLFDASRKRALPRFPRRIGLITSAGGAVLHDVITTTRQRWPNVEIVLYPSLVQGASAASALRTALTTVNARNEVEVVILARGGGSIEDLWAFNDEQLARAIAASAIPTVSAVGHETDFTIADFVADMRAPTPTFAATLVVPELREWQQRVDGLYAALASSVRGAIADGARRVTLGQARLQRPTQRLAMQRERLLSAARRARHAIEMRPHRDQLREVVRDFELAAPDVNEYWDALTQRALGLHRAVTDRVARQSERLHRAERAMQHLSPRAVLTRGYAWVERREGGVVTSVQQVAIGETLSVVVQDGRIGATVTEKSKN